MKKLLIISFDLIREGEANTSLAIASLLAHLKQDPQYGIDFISEHLSINMLNIADKRSVSSIYPYFHNINLHNFDYIALSAYIWNEYATNPLIHYFRKEQGFTGEIILGGYQISYSDNPSLEYPDVQYFIEGYAEQQLLNILKTGNTKGSKNNVVFNHLASPYLMNTLPIEYGQKMVRLETKRGCPYQCTFCAHRDLTNHRVNHFKLDKVFRELAFLQEKNVQKVNILDPIFNAGKDYIEILQEMDRINFKPLTAIQARFETIFGDKGDLFLELCAKLNIQLEFGIQTAIREESMLIKRKNKPEHIKQAMHKINRMSITYEISLIYGLPSQTLSSFQKSIDFVINNGCSNLTAFPLMLLKGTELYQQKEQFGFKEESIDEFNIPIVTASNSFNHSDWIKMHEIANSLQPNLRL